MTAKTYRPEIDGLRAIAVVSVILFHAGFDAFAGGFLGVDIFFVISGYLITGIIQAELEQGKFSIWRFYERRIRRILPALIVVMLLCIPPAVYVMVPDELQNFGQSLVATTASANNILLYMTSGYFAQANEFKPLMHSWSLGVEEQYYLAVPLLMWATYRLGKRRAVWGMIVLLSIASFALCLYLSKHDPVANFFMIWSRTWELGAGAAVALAEPRLRRTLQMPPALAPWVSLAALAMILVPMLTIGRETSLPGWLTLVPVAGTGMLLGLATPGDAVTRLLTLRPIVGIGLVSYSAYLYHQPVYAFVRLTSLDEPGAPVLIGLIFVTFALAWLSYKLVEQPFRDRKRASTRAVLAFAIGGSAITLAAGLYLHRTQGLYASRTALHADPGFSADANARFVDGPRRLENAVLPEAAPAGGKRLLVLGDSFARDFVNMGRESGATAHAAVSYMGAGDQCDGVLAPAVRANAMRADHVVIAFAMEVETIACIDTIAAAVRRVTAAPITVIGTKNFGWNNSAVLMLPAGQRYGYRARPLTKTVEVNRMARERLKQWGYVDVIGAIADTEGRVPVFTPEGKFISQDRNHLTQAGAAWLGGILFARAPLNAIPGR